jgi:Kef-type K+ transport system membrane component KefB
MSRGRIGTLVLTCAAVDDVTAWCVLAVVVAVVGSSGPLDVLLAVGLALGFVLAMIGVIRPLLRRLDRIGVPLAATLALACAWMTEAIGIHAIFGAFLAGAVLPRRADLRLDLSGPLESTVNVVLLPVFFVVVGLSTEIGSLDSAWLWVVTAAVVALAVVGKLGGAAVSARVVGERWTDALRIGVLMNTRGLTELVILTVGLQLGVLDTTSFTMLVVMALATTAMTTPLLAAIGHRRSPADDVPAAPLPSPGTEAPGGSADLGS